MKELEAKSRHYRQTSKQLHAEVTSLKAEVQRLTSSGARGGDAHAQARQEALVATSQTLSAAATSAEQSLKYVFSSEPFNTFHLPICQSQYLILKLNLYLFSDNFSRASTNYALCHSPSFRSINFTNFLKIRHRDVMIVVS